LCQKIEVESYNFIDYGNNALTYSGKSLGETNYTSVSGDTVLYYRNNQFYPLLNFGASLGDSWVISVDAPMNVNDSDSSEVIVTKVDSILINNQYFRFIEIEMNTCSKYHYEGTFVERFGLLSSSTSNLFPIEAYYPCPFDSTVFYHPTEYSFKCFKDDSFVLYNPSTEDCEYLLNILAVHEHTKPNWLLYPNPTNQVVQVTGQQISGKELAIFDVLGQLVTKVIITSDNFNLPVNHFESGLYFLKIAGFDSAQKLVIE
jgi:hypothetical protein